MGSQQWVTVFPALNFTHIYLSFFGYPLMMTANYASIWSICAICLQVPSLCSLIGKELGVRSLQRFLAICYPLKSRRWGVQNHDVCVILAITGLAFLLNVIRYEEHSLAYHIVNGPPPSSPSSLCDRLAWPAGTVQDVWLIEGRLYRTPIYYILMSIAYVTFVYLIPLLLLTLLNGRMLIAIHRSNRLKQRVSSNERKERKVASLVRALRPSCP